MRFLFGLLAVTALAGAHIAIHYGTQALLNFANKER